MKYLILFTIPLLFGCERLTDTKAKNIVTDFKCIGLYSNFPENTVVHSFKMNNHNFIQFGLGEYRSVVHDPDCGCGKK